MVGSRVGRHAVMLEDRVLAVGADLVERWGRLGALWALAPIEDFLVEVLDRPLLKLPPVGALRLDDAPSTAQMQLEGRAKTDSVGVRRARKLLRSYSATGAKLSIAVAARGLEDGEPVPAERVWPESIAELGRGCAEGVFEPIGHGWLHYDPELTTTDKVEPREFAALDEAAAGERIDAVLEWQREHLGEPKTFVAPAWGYSSGALKALAARGLPAWHRAAPEPLLVDGNPRETLIGPGGIGGVHRLDYGSLVRLANAGVPPTLALHGGLMDDRLESRILRDAPGYARLLLKRDARRLPRIRGIRWIGAAELVERYRAHEATEVVDGEPRIPAGAEVIVRDRNGQRAVRG